MVPPLTVCAVMVLESNVVAASGGLPVALAVTSQDPRVEPATATEPAALAMVEGLQPGCHNKINKIESQPGIAGP